MKNVNIHPCLDKRKVENKKQAMRRQDFNDRKIESQLFLTIFSLGIMAGGLMAAGIIHVLSIN